MDEDSRRIGLSLVDRDELALLTKFTSGVVNELITVSFDHKLSTNIEGENGLFAIIRDCDRGYLFGIDAFDKITYAFSEHVTIFPGPYRGRLDNLTIFFIVPVAIQPKFVFAFIAWDRFSPDRTFAYLISFAGLKNDSSIDNIVEL